MGDAVQLEGPNLCPLRAAKGDHGWETGQSGPPVRDVRSNRRAHRRFSSALCASVRERLASDMKPQRTRKA